MKLNLKSKKTKAFAILGLAFATLVPGIMSMTPANTKADEANGVPMYDLVSTRTIQRNDGGGGFGTHTYPSYQEGGVQYYRDGDIIELSVSLPKNHGAAYLEDVVKFDASKVELLSSFNNIRSTLGANYSQKGWDSYVANYMGDRSQISLAMLAADYTVGAEWQGGTLARMYFRVLPNTESEAGTAINFEFPKFSSGSYVNGAKAITTKGYNAGAGSDTYASEPITVTAKKPAVQVTPPALNLLQDSVEIFEGDMFNPASYVKDASCGQDPSISKNSVVISEGTGSIGKQQPSAGAYNFKYTVTSGVSGESTEKMMKLTVTPRTYSVQSIETADKTITIEPGTTSADFEAMVEKMKGEDFKTTIASNDGSHFVADGKVVSGSTDTYKVDGDDKLIEQTFNVTYKVAMPLVSYTTEGKRVVTTYNGNPGFTSNVTPAQADAVVSVSVKKGTGNGNNNGNSGNNGSNVGGNNTKNPSTAVGGSGATNTGDTTDMNALLALAGISLVGIVGYKFRTRLTK